MLNFTRLQSATILIAVVTILVRALTLLRDSLMAGRLGLSQNADEFFLLLDWSHFITTVIATSAIHFFIPQIKILSAESDTFLKRQDQFNSQFVFAVLIASLLMFLGFLFLSSFEVPLILVCCFIFISQSMSQYLSALLNLKGWFLVPSLLFGLPILATFAFFILNLTSGYSLLLLFLVGSIVQTLVIYLIFAFYWGQKLKMTLLSFKDYFIGFSSWLWLALATLYFPAAHFLNVQLASFAGEGMVSMISYASRIPFAISNILIFAFWTVALPTSQSKGTEPKLNHQDTKRLLKTGALCLGITFLGVILSEQMVALFYGHGNAISSESLKDIVFIQRIYFSILSVQVLTSLFIRFLHVLGQIRVTIVVCTLGLLVQFLCYGLIDQPENSIPLGFALNFIVVALLLIIWRLLARIQVNQSYT